MKRRLGGSLVALTLVLGVSACSQADGPKSPEPSTAAVSTGSPSPEPEENGSQVGEVEAPSEAMKSFVTEVENRVKKHWGKMDRVWPGMDYTKHDLLILRSGETGETAGGWLINTEGSRELKPHEYAELFTPGAGGYEQIKYDGRDAIIMGIDEDLASKGAKGVDEFYRVATHELVHFYHQPQASSADDDRAQPYPLEENPRVYRRMIYDHLVAALKEPGKRDDHLGRAAHWYKRWKDEYAEEATAIRGTDNDEGIARYVENAATFVGDGTAVRDGLIKNIKSETDFNSAAAESYEVGFVAAALLDEKAPDWKDGFYDRGDSVLEKLFEGVSPIEEEVDPNVEKNVKEFVNEINTSGAEALKDIEKAHDDTSVPYLRIDETEAAGSFGVQDTFRYQDMEVMTKYTRDYTIEGGSASLKGVSVVAEGEGDRMLVTIPLTGEHTLDGDQLTVKMDGLTMTGKVEVSEQDGRKIYTAVASQ